MSDHRQMRKLTVKTGKKISAEAENTLQATFTFKNQLSDHIEVASTLRSEYDKLRIDLESLQADNARLASEPTASDVALRKELESVQKDAESLQLQLDKESSQGKEADSTLIDLQNQIDALRNQGNIFSEGFEIQREKYRKTLKIDIQKLSKREIDEGEAKFQVTFLDLDQSVILIKESELLWRIEGVPNSIRGNASHSLGLTKMLCEAREQVKRRHA